MVISYNKLWKLLIDRKMSKADLRRAAGIAPNTMTKLNRDEEVTLETVSYTHLWVAIRDFTLYPKEMIMSRL